MSSTLTRKNPTPLAGWLTAGVILFISLGFIYGLVIDSGGNLDSYCFDLPTGQTLVFLQAFLGW